MQFDAFELDEENARLTRQGVPVALPPKAFSVLCALARQPGQLQTKESLLDQAWGHQHVSESVLKTTISQLRAALDDDAKQPRYIETASRRGYRFTATPAAAPARQAPPAPAGAAPEVADAVAPADTTLVARDAALQALLRHWRGAAGGRRQVVWVAGEPGVGKSRLIDALIACLGPVTCAVGQCVEQFGAGEPYLPVLDALASLCRQDPGLPTLMRRVAPTWLLQMPWLAAEADRAALQHELAGASQDRMLREMGELLDRYSAQRPLLLVTEDLHWSDQATVRLIDHVARRRAPAALMWLGSFRPAELIAGEHPLKGVRQELRAHRLCDEVLLEPFSEQDVARYVAARFPGQPVPEAFARALHGRTDGLPLFVVNVVDELLLQGRVAPQGLDAAALAASWAIPESLVGVIERQFERLPDETRELLSAASVCGMEFRPETLADALQRDAAWVHERCDRLVRVGHWLVPLTVARRADGSLDAPYSFRHALYRQVLLQRLGPARRVRAHLRIAGSLLRARERGAAVAAAEIAMHFEAGQDIANALRHHADAAASAMRHFAPLESSRHAEHGLALLPRLADAGQRLELELALTTQLGIACTQLQGVASPAAVTALARARTLCEQLPGTADRALVMIGLGWIAYARGDFASGRELAARIDDLARASGSALLRAATCNLMGCLLCNSGHQSEARQWFEQGLAMCPELAASRPLAGFVVDPEVSMRSNLSQPLLHLGLAGKAREQVSTALAVARAVGQPMARMLACWCGCMTEIHFDAPASALQLAQELQAIVDVEGVVQGEGPGLWYRGWVLARQGQPQTGVEMILEGYARHARFGMFCGCAKVLGYAADAMIFAADWDAAQRHLDDALALARRIGETLDVPGLLLRRSRIQLGRGDPAGAGAALREAATLAQAIGARGFEVEALTALAGLQGPQGAALQALRAACADLPAGFDPRLRQPALALLAAA